MKCIQVEDAFFPVLSNAYCVKEGEKLVSTRYSPREKSRWQTGYRLGPGKF